VVQTANGRWPSKLEPATVTACMLASESASPPLAALFRVNVDPPIVARPPDLARGRDIVSAVHMPITCQCGARTQEPHISRRTGSATLMMRSACKTTCQCGALDVWQRGTPISLSVCLFRVAGQLEACKQTCKQWDFVQMRSIAFW
jgi:hypothetical protein